MLVNLVSPKTTDTSALETDLSRLLKDLELKLTSSFRELVTQAMESFRSRIETELESFRKAIEDLNKRVNLLEGKISVTHIDCDLVGEDASRSQRETAVKQAMPR